MELTAALMAHARINEAGMIDAVDAAAGEGAYGCEEEETSRESEPDGGEPSSPVGDWTDGRTDGSVSHRQSIAYILS
jgi:hypothetical protein